MASQSNTSDSFDFSELPPTWNRYHPSSFLCDLDLKKSLTSEQAQELLENSNFTSLEFRNQTGEIHELAHDFQFRGTHWGFFLSLLQYQASVVFQRAWNDPNERPLINKFRAELKTGPIFRSQAPLLQTFQSNLNSFDFLFSKNCHWWDPRIYADSLCRSIQTTFRLCQDIFQWEFGTVPNLIWGSFEAWESLRNIPVISILEAHAKAFEWAIALDSCLLYTSDAADE